MRILLFLSLLSSNESNLTNISVVSASSDILRVLGGADDVVLLSSGDIFVSFVSLDDDLVAHPGARTWCHALPWWALCCSLSSQTAAA